MACKSGDSKVKCINCQECGCKNQTFPVGCKCEEGVWGHLPIIPPICDSFESHKANTFYVTDVCVKCEHDKACHENKLI